MGKIDELEVRVAAIEGVFTTIGCVIGGIIFIGWFGAFVYLIVTSIATSTTLSEFSKGFYLAIGLVMALIWGIIVSIFNKILRGEYS